MTKISSFVGQYRFLSNFYPSPITAGGIEFATVEHAYQASKVCRAMNSEARRALQTEIAGLESPGEAKRFGKTVPLRDDWEHMKLPMMTALVEHKFWVHEDLARLLKQTEPHLLVEGNNWNDRFWGVSGGRGMNHLGLILMDIRDQLPTQ